MSSLLNHLDPNQRSGIQEWLNRNPSLANMDEQALMLLLLFKLEHLEHVVKDIQLNTKTHWVN